jgi:hypothetical protein
MVFQFPLHHILSSLDTIYISECGVELELVMKLLSITYIDYYICLMSVRRKISIVLLL